MGLLSEGRSAASLGAIDVQSTLVTELRYAAERLRQPYLPATYSEQMATLADSVRQACTVAVVGRVKAGKSTFVNALLGDDLAKVGTLETTATINWFRYGEEHPTRPVLCHWRSGATTRETRTFLDSLQGNDEATLRQARDIDHLEYHLPIPLLERINLVDTPGAGAAVTEHRDRTAAFLQLDQELRTYHDEETRRLEREADAVIYLVGATAMARDRDFLEKFHESFGGRASSLNAFGVLAQIDREQELLERRDAIAEHIARDLRTHLTTVVPVSAGLRRALDNLNVTGVSQFDQIIHMARSIPRDLLPEALEDESYFLSDDLPCAVPVAGRKALLGDLPWMVFTTMVRLAAASERSRDGLLQELAGLAGFDRLKSVLESQFLRRGRFLRSYRVLLDARGIVSHLRYHVVHRARQWVQQQCDRKDRWLAFLARSSPNTTAQELQEFVASSLAPPDDLSTLVDDLDRRFAAVAADLEEFHAESRALFLVEEHPDLFPESDELRALFGLYGVDLESRSPVAGATMDYFQKQHQYWRDLAMRSVRAERRDVADRAAVVYQSLISVQRARA